LNRLNSKLLLLFSCASCFVVPASAAINYVEQSGDVREWNFRVYLGDSEIGYHTFRLTNEDDREKLVTEANFKVKFLFVTAYKYEHFSTETWADDCLQQIDSKTDANGKNFEISGQQGTDNFEVKAAESSREMTGCIKTFAYWNPDFLQESVLLNSQTGVLMPVVVEPHADDTLTVRGEDVPARRYKLRGENLDLDIWYSENEQWLGLESTTNKGQTLRYELI